MAKFNFNFQGILNIKEKLEEQKKIDLGNATKYLTAQQQILIVHKSSLMEKQKEFYIKNGTSMYVKELVELSKAIKYYEEQVKTQSAIVEMAKKKVEEKRKLLVKAVIEKKTYEKLKEIALEEYLKSEELANQKQLDELSSFKVSKRQE